MMSMTERIDGAKALIEWFGQWPSFHDAEVLELSLNRNGRSLLRIHTWHSTSAVDAAGHFRHDKDVVVQFDLIDVYDCEIVGFNAQNVLGLLQVDARDDGLRLSLDSVYGLGGWIDARQVSLTFLAGMPPKP